MRRLPNDIDIHTHSGPLRYDAVVCVDPTATDELPAGNGLLSVGIHPWNAAAAGPDAWQRLERWAADPRVVAIGEIGLDKNTDADEQLQSEVFQRQLELAANACLPVIIHCVGRADRLLQMRKNFAGQWIYHGFRGKPELARQLLEAGIDLSFGERYNPESFSITPPDRRYHETD